jgi:mannose-6-phosphate isomerase-like protein (cupin superfamily)
MNTHRNLLKTLPGLAVVLPLVLGPAHIAEATPPSGVSFTILTRATLPAFDVKRKIKELDHWQVELEADQPIDVVVAVFTVQPGGQGGWHTHPGPSLWTITQGAMTIYEGDDPTCTPHVYTAGTGDVEATTNTHIHNLRNETGSVAQTVVTFLLPVGAPLRIDLPDPGYCPF